MAKRKRKAGRPKGTKAKGKRGGLAPNQYLDDKQLARLLRHVSLEAEEARRWGRKRAVVNNIIVNILVYSGLRADELCKLNIRDLPSYHEKNQIFVYNGKGSISRTIDIPEALAKKLSRFVRLHRKGAKPNEPLLVGERRKRLSYRGLYSRIKSIGERVGLPELHPHALRH
ncbi:MAG: tyrosine-type recombinase/integrase, partial [Planctomycetota bacterium]